MPFIPQIIVNKQKFNTYLNNPTKLSQEDLSSFDTLEKNFPYSQIVRSIIAKAHTLSGSDTAQSKINYAAIHATDRSVLKEYIQGTGQKNKVRTQKKATEKPTPRKIKKEKYTAPKSGKPPQKSEVKKPMVRSSQHDIEMENLRAEVMDGLSQLAILKENINLESWGLPNVEKKKKVKKSKREKDSKPTEKNSPKPEQKEQFDIIDQFISNGSKISPKKKPDPKVDEPNFDLTDESKDFTDDLISENLAVILIKQGKTSRAIDIYKKLIWKYPQKKAYFAEQIKKLEN